MRIAKLMAVVIGLALPVMAQNVTAPAAPRIESERVMPAPIDAPVVAGQPYSLEVTETRESTLSDGSYATTQTMRKRARDSDGRIWMSTMSKLEGKEYEIVVINDPIAHETIILNGWNKTAEIQPPQPLTPERRAAIEAKRAKAAANKTVQPPKPPSMESENLGTQFMEGIRVEGRRVTNIIPAGRMGNDHEVRSVTEYWNSPDLKIDMEILRDNPMGDKSTEKVTSIDRGEPDPALFRIPEDYKIVDKNPETATAQP